MKARLIWVALVMTGVSRFAMAAGSDEVTIRFQGAVVAQSCAMEQQPTRLQVNCDQTEPGYNTELSLSTLAVRSPPAASSYEVSKIWLNKEKREAIVVIRYK
ncbi:hypothetical protein FT673_09010 [Aeromonas hydrophila]|nr:hypothetical protein FT673_09010 [Aeromonas hydrophila]